MAEGLPAEPGHVPAHMHPRTMLSRDNWVMVNRQDGRDSTTLPVTERLATTVHVWLPHNILLGSSQDVADIATAVEKVAGALQGPDYDKALELASTTPQVWYESAEI
jgi:hypothetical protein